MTKDENPLLSLLQECKTGDNNIVRHELVKITLPANTPLPRLNFPDIPNLRNARIRGIRVLTAEFVGKTVENETPVTFNTLKNGVFVTLQSYDGNNFMYRFPAVDLVDYKAVTNARDPMGQINVRDMIGQPVNYPKSYVEFAPNVQVAADTVLLFSIYYRYSSRDEQAMFSSRLSERS